MIAFSCAGVGLGDALTLPAYIEVIEAEAFAGNPAVTELVVPEGARRIANRAFAETGLREVTLPATLMTIAGDAFDGCDIAGAHAPWGSVAFDYCRAKGWYINTPWTDKLKIATYRGEVFKLVNTPLDPVFYAGLVRDRLCTSPGGTGRYSGNCLGFAYYYQYCMVDNITDVQVSVALRDYQESRKLRYATEKYGNSGTMMERLYDLLNTGVPQIIMVEAITHPGSRHFVTVVGYRASVNRREDLRVTDLLIIDSFDGKLESMDPEIELVDTRVLFKQEGRYRIEAAWPRS